MILSNADIEENPSKSLFQLLFFVYIISARDVQLWRQKISINVCIYVCIRVHFQTMEM
jgi:hypothetical protein